MCNKVAFVVDKIDMGGLQKVNVTIVNELSNISKNKVYLYSMQKYFSYYPVDNNVYITYGERNKIEHVLVILLKLVRKLINILFNKKVPISEKYQLKKLENFIVKNGIQTVVLNSPALLYVNKLREDFPNLNIIMWMHNNAKTYMEVYYKDSATELVSNMNNSDTVISLTQIDKIDYSKYSNNIRLLHNPLTIDTKGKISELNTRVISIVCRLDIEHKGLDYLIELGKKLPDNWRIELAGDGSKDAIETLEKMIKSNGVTNKIILKGPLKGVDLINHYTNSSIYLMTSRWEGMPLVLAEAMSFGLPIIAFDQTGSSEVLDKGKYGILVEKGNIEEMALQLTCLTNDIELRKKYQKLSLERVKDFDISIIIKKWQEVLNNTKEGCEKLK